MDLRMAYKRTRCRQSIRCVLVQGLGVTSQTAKMNRCANCRVPCEENVCRLCRDVRECQKCSVVEEREIPTSELDVVLHDFLNKHEEEIIRTLERAVNQRRYDKWYKI